MLLHWHTEPFLLISLIGMGWIYALIIGPFRKSCHSFPLTHCCWFYIGLALAYLTVGSPLDQIGESFLFSAHMWQHMLLVYALPIFFIKGIPHWLIDKALSQTWIQKPFRIVSYPVTAGWLFTCCYTLWHVPVLYESALQVKWIHSFEHITVFLTALLMWWPFLSPSKIVPRTSYGFLMLYIFGLMVGQLPVFGFLTLSETTLYPTYIYAPRITSLDPLQDQILGGLIMKITNMIISLTLLIVCFYKWYQQENQVVHTKTQ